MNFKIIALIIIAIVFLYRLFLNILHAKSAGNPIPENVADIYDKQTYSTWRQYHFEKTRLAIFVSCVSFLTEFILIATNAYAGFAALFVGGDFMQMFAVVLLSGLADLLLIPFTYYDTMVIEQNYGFNRSDKKTFWSDQVKQLFIGFLLMFGLGWLLIWAHHTFGDWLIVIVAAAMTLVALGIAFLYPFLSKIFNKFTPLEDGELKEKVTALLEGHGYKVRAIQVMDASRRTSKSNAYFSGFGKMKTIVLYDTLIAAMTPDEICAVFAHEMGHGLHKDTLRNQILTFLQMAVLAVLAWLTLRSPVLFESFGFKEVNYGFALILIMSVEFALIAPLFSLVASYFSRKAEYAADRQAVIEGYGPSLISGLKKLAKENFSDLAPSKIVVALEYSHPTLSHRERDGEVRTRDKEARRRNGRNGNRTDVKQPKHKQRNKYINKRAETRFSALFFIACESIIYYCK